MHGSMRVSSTAGLLFALLLGPVTMAGPGGGPPADLGKPARVGDLVEERFGTPHPYPPGRAGGTVVWEQEIHWPGASYIAVHFETFRLAPGDQVELTDPDGRVRHVYRGRGHMERGGDFWGLSVAGDTMLIRLVSESPRHRAFGFTVDRYAHGYPIGTSTADTEGTEAICGVDDSEDAVCYQSSHPDEYERSRAVVKLLKNGVDHCTGWLASCENHIFTNEHCIQSQSVLDDIEFQFLYQRPACGSGTPAPELQLQGGTLVNVNSALDYALVLPNLAGNDPQATYGYLQLDLRIADPDERIYIPQHPRGDPKQLAIFSDNANDESGFCEVYSLDEPPCSGGPGDMGYFCDTDYGSSGSPVISGDTHRVVALHHCRYCPNRGVHILDVYDDLVGAGTPLPACSTELPDEYYPTEVATSQLLSGIGNCMADFASCQVLRDEDLRPLPPSTDIVMTGGGWTGSCFYMGWRCPQDQMDVYINDPNLTWPDWCLADGEGYTLYGGVRYDFRGVSVEGCTALPFSFTYEYLCDTDADCYSGHVCELGSGLCRNPCPDADGDGWTVCDGDCDDGNPDVHPNRSEVCGNSIDDDCDGTINEGCNGGGSPVFRKPDIQVAPPPVP